MGDPTQDEIRHDIAIKFDNIKTVVVGSDFMETCKILRPYDGLFSALIILF
jgi:hypothetical protein